MEKQYEFKQNNQPAAAAAQNDETMPHLDHKGPEGKGPRTGRGLGLCKGKDDKKNEWPVGRGMGKRRRADAEGTGKGRRLRSGKQFDKGE